MDDLKIFPEVDGRALKKCKVAVFTAQVITFSLAGLSFLFVMLAIFVPTDQEDESGAKIALYFFAVLTLIYLVLGIVSTRKMFVPMLLVTMLSASVLALIIVGFFALGRNYPPAVSWSIITVLLGIVLMQARGAALAKKYNELSQMINF